MNWRSKVIRVYSAFDKPELELSDAGLPRTSQSFDGAAGMLDSYLHDCGFPSPVRVSVTFPHHETFVSGAGVGGVAAAAKAGGAILSRVDASFVPAAPTATCCRHLPL